MYEALITDLDGTAVNISSDGSDIDSDTQQAVATALQHGKKITCATGREWAITKGIVEKLGIISPCIIEGGTRLIDPNNEETLWEKAFDHGVPAQILSIFKSHTSEGKVTHSDDISLQPLNDVESIPESLRYLYLIATPQDVAVSVCNQINLGENAVAHLTPSWAGNGLADIHVTHPEATKEHAIKVWQELEGVTELQTIGMGDSGNDVPIFQASGFKVAVGNATPALKELADYIAPSVADHALKHVIETVLLRES